MKWLFRGITLSILGIAVGLAFFLQVEDGRPRLGLPDTGDWTLPDMPAIPALPETVTQPEPTITTVYKWQDKRGRWHYGDAPPAEGQAQELKVSNQTNIVPSLTDADRARLGPEPAPAGTATGTFPPAPAKTSSESSIDGVLGTLGEAKAVSARIEARNREVERLVEGQ